MSVHSKWVVGIVFVAIGLAVPIVIEATGKDFEHVDLSVMVFSIILGCVFLVRALKKQAS